MIFVARQILVHVELHKIECRFEQRFAAGQASALDVARERTSRAQMELAIRDLERAAADARVQLASAIGVPVQALDGIAISLAAFDSAPPAAAFGRSADELRRRALTGRTDVEASRELTGDLSSTIEESASGIRVLKAFGREARQVEHLQSHDLVNQLIDAQKLRMDKMREKLEEALQLASAPVADPHRADQWIERSRAMLDCIVAGIRQIDEDARAPVHKDKEHAGSVDLF